VQGTCVRLRLCAPAVRGRDRAGSRRGHSKIQLPYHSPVTEASSGSRSASNRCGWWLKGVNRCAQMRWGRVPRFSRNEKRIAAKREKDGDEQEQDQAVGELAYPTRRRPSEFPQPRFASTTSSRRPMNVT
jgi:hypothetical protein